MEQKLRKKIEKTVWEILEKSDWDKATEKQIRKQASERLELDLDEPEYKNFIREVVNSFIEENKAKQKENEEDGDGNGDGDNADRLICKVRNTKLFSFMFCATKPFYFLGSLNRIELVNKD